MTKEKIQVLLKHYSKLKTAIKNDENYFIITGYRKKKIVEIDDEVKLFANILVKLKTSIKDKEVLKVFELSYENNLSDRAVLCRIFMADSTFYRIKNKLFNQVMLLCAVNNLLIEDEILKMQI